MLKVGLTGGIACGKTVVRRRLAELGAYTIDADVTVHELMMPGTELTLEIERVFGTEMLTEEGAVDRARLGALVFENSEAREKLNRLVHPCVLEEQERLLREAGERGEPVAIVDAALMIEVGTYRKYDFLVVVYCPRSTQIERLLKRDGYARDEAERRIDAQMPVDEKRDYADFVVDTSGSLEETVRQTDELWKKLRELVETGRRNAKARRREDAKRD
jgi:dephospho-CoA kinase